MYSSTQSPSAPPKSQLFSKLRNFSCRYLVINLIIFMSLVSYVAYSATKRMIKNKSSKKAELISTQIFGLNLTDFKGEFLSIDMTIGKCDEHITWKYKEVCGELYNSCLRLDEAENCKIVSVKLDDNMQSEVAYTNDTDPQYTISAFDLDPLLYANFVEKTLKSFQPSLCKVIKENASDSEFDLDVKSVFSKLMNEQKEQDGTEASGEETAVDSDNAEAHDISTKIQHIISKYIRCGQWRNYHNFNKWGAKFSYGPYVVVSSNLATGNYIVTWETRRSPKSIVTVDHGFDGTTYDFDIAVLKRNKNTN